MQFQYTKHFELINYSPNGTYVNNILYSNNTATKRPDLNMSTDEKSANVERQVREIIDKKRKISRTGQKSTIGNVEYKMAAAAVVDCLDKWVHNTQIRDSKTDKFCFVIGRNAVAFSIRKSWKKVGKVPRSSITVPYWGSVVFRLFFRLLNVQIDWSLLT